MDRRSVLLCLLIVTVAATLLPAAAAQASGADVIRDCTQNGTLTKRYSAGEYREALATLPADVDEYGDCREIIREGQLDVAAGGDGIGSSPLIGSAAETAPATPQEHDAIAQATAEPSLSPIPVGGEPLTPGRSATSSSAQGLLHEVPTPIIVVLALLGAVALGLAAFLGGRRAMHVFRRGSS